MDKMGVLKIIGKLTGLSSRTHITSRELGDKCNMSQQRAATYLIELEELGWIKRNVGVRGQGVWLTEAGKGQLFKEYVELRELFEHSDSITLVGEVVSGLGEGSYYISQDGYADQFRSYLGFKPYPGTLNLRLMGIDLARFQSLRSMPGILIEGFKSEGRSFGSALCHKCTFQDDESVSGAILIPKRTHYTDVIEIVSNDFLRDKFSLDDGVILRVRVKIKSQKDVEDSCGES